MADAHATSAFEKVYAKKWSFVAAFTLVYFLTLLGLSLFGLNPLQSSLTDQNPSAGGGKNIAVQKGELPVRIEIPSIDVKANVTNPQTTDIASLDAALRSGAVRYPNSAVPGENGNVLMFGHSSYLPVVHNKAYKAFNNIQSLKAGDLIYIVGTNHVYVYSVETVTHANTATGEIPLSVTGAKLTLATCDSFGQKSDRFIVSANLSRVDSISGSQAN